MRQSLQLITLAVSDVDASRGFYSDGLGWTPVLDLPEVVFYQVGHGLLLSLFRREDFSDDVGAPAEAGSGFSLAQVVDSTGTVDAIAAAARAAGAEILKPPQQASFGGYHTYFADPDGHRWEIAYNPGFSVAEDGTVSLSEITVSDHP
ncbi:VOC family protein [Jatrophihabitans telluris]|uniref:VOC family protein n=1 Tax=Jatrophihabitans telluris TaxID=2038343 RepID=A0ABY4R059_9ACTN|nr:VOC family protein [Jatrophihabitans telluris]UQX88892.1 VOC family protein [Jatrophihabitans telluris]